MPEIELPQGWIAWVGFIITVTIGLAIRDWASDFIAAVKWKMTPGFEPMDTCILDGDKVTIIHIGLRETIFERDSKYGRTWQYIPSSKISSHDLGRVVGDDRMLDNKINGDI
jgi:hypothetical protein|tara:strand:- start:793 stop:1128 length:336 start_codon:yes stop_codon:yes gene_type:complete